MTTFIPRRITACASKAGKTYWKIETDQGEATCFDYPIVQALEGSIGKPISLYDLESNNGFVNIRPTRHAKAEAKAQAVAPLVATQTQMNNFAEARQAKDVSIYTSYAKDLFIATLSLHQGAEEGTAKKVMQDCIDLIKQAKVSFERSEIAFKSA